MIFLTTSKYGVGGGRGLRVSDGVGWGFEAGGNGTDRVRRAGLSVGGDGLSECGSGPVGGRTAWGGFQSESRAIKVDQGWSKLGAMTARRHPRRAKQSFAPEGIPKCNFGTRDGEESKRIQVNPTMFGPPSPPSESAAAAAHSKNASAWRREVPCQAVTEKT